jgi:hypothetical protein
LQQRAKAGLLGGQPQGSGQTEVACGGREGHGSGVLLHQFGQFFCRTQVGLMGDAGLAMDTGTFDQVVIEAVAFFLFDERSHTG